MDVGDLSTMRAGRAKSFLVAMLMLVSACAPVAGDAGEPRVEAAGDGILDCNEGQVVRAADIEIAGPSEAAVVATALQQWTRVGGVVVAIPSQQLWTVVVEGRDAAIAYPEINGDGTWVVQDVQTCGDPKTGAAAIDGELDCVNEYSWTLQGSIDPNATGTASPEGAVREALERYAARHGGDIALVDQTVGALVVQQREVVVARASEVPAGGWVAITVLGCEDFQ